MSVDHECQDCGERYNEPKFAAANHVCDPALLKQRAENLSEHLSDQRFLCREHGLGVKADEDGCCVTCGGDCAHVAVLVDFPEEEEEEEEAAIIPRAALGYLYDIVQLPERFLCVWNTHDECWGLPGGREEKGDGGRLGVTLERELREEIDLCVSVRDMPVFTGLPNDPTRVRSVSVFALPLAGRTQQGEPNAPLRMFAREEFLRCTKFRRFYEAFFDVLDRLRRSP